MADNFDNYSMKVQARVDLPSNKDIDAQIRKLEKSISKLKVSGQFDDTALRNLTNQLNTLKASITTANFSPTALTELTNQVNRALQNINIGNINVGGVGNQAQQVGQQIGNNIAQGVANGVGKATTTVKSFSALMDSMKSQKVELNTEGLIDDKKTLDAIKQTYSEFGQVKITNKVFDAGQLQSFKVNIEQVNGELKETRTFMMQLSDNGKFFVFPDDTIKGTEKYVQHLNAAKNATNATGEALNAQNQRLAEQAKYYGKIKEETNHLYSLKQKLLSADELQTAELNKQIKSTKQRITYNNQQLDKKGLRDNSLEREINDLVVAREKQLALSDAKAQDTANTKAQAQAQREANAVLKEQQALQERVNKIQLLSNGGIKNDYATQIAKLEGDFRSLGLAQDTIATKTQNVKNSLATLRAEFAKPVDQQNFQAIQTANDKLQRELTESRNEFEQLRASMKGMATEQQRLSLANTIEAWNQKNTAATKAVREENDRYIASLRDLNTQMTKTQLGQINTTFKQTENSMRALNKLGASFVNQMKQGIRSFSTWLSASTLVMKTISETREAVANIKELDNTLTEISKTSDMTADALERLGQASYDVASKYGRTSNDYLSAYESMARSGFYGEVGQGMSELSLLAQAAGDMSQEIADNYLLATNAAYKFGGNAEKLNGVLDGMNIITNRNSVALEDMASAMSKAGATASAYNVSVEDLSAMIGTMEAVTKSGGDEVGNSLKSILINLQNVTSSKITGTLDEANASMTTFVDGVEKLRNPIEILRDLSKTFNELDEDDPLRAEILTNIGGKYQANKLSALLQNMELFDKMLVDYSEGSGSALEEATKSANNLTGRLNALQNSWNELINSVIQADDLKLLVNILNGLTQSVTNLIKPLGTLGTIGLGAGLFAGVKNFGKTYECMLSKK